jgi:hypothetical protein
MAKEVAGKAASDEGMKWIRVLSELAWEWAGNR